MKHYAIIDQGYGPVTIGPFSANEARDSAVRQYLNNEQADAGDGLSFADLQDDFRLETYHMDVNDFLPKGRRA